MNNKYLESLNLPVEAIEEWSKNWDLSQACKPDGAPFFLQEEYLEDMADICGLRDEARPALYECGALIRGNEALSRLAWHCHWLAHIATPEQAQGASPWSKCTEARSPMGATFFMGIVTMAALPRITAYYLERGIPEQVLRDSALAFDIWAEDYFNKHGVWGCDHGGWVSQHTVPTLFRLGRLEFQFASFNSPFMVYRNKTTREIAIMAPPDLNMTEEGFFCQDDETPAMKTTRTVTEQQAVGYVALPNGRMGSQPVTLPLADWELLFQQGDKMINVHIPACAPLDYDDCKNSISMAREFFPKYFPAFDFKGFQCGSWLLDPRLQECLPPTANIPRFQSLFHLYPAIKGNDWQIKERVFGNPELTMDQVPQKTSLQKIVRQRILNGPRFRSGACFLPRQD